MKVVVKCQYAKNKFSKKNKSLGTIPQVNF